MLSKEIIERIREDAEIYALKHSHILQAPVVIKSYVAAATAEATRYEQEMKGKWVKVEDGLPEGRKEVIVYFKNSAGWYVTSAIFDKGIGFFSHDDPVITGIFPPYSVTHWMPLPQSPNINK